MKKAYVKRIWRIFKTSQQKEYIHISDNRHAKKTVKCFPQEKDRNLTDQFGLQYSLDRKKVGHWASYLSSDPGRAKYQANKLCCDKRNKSTLTRQAEVHQVLQGSKFGANRSLSRADIPRWQIYGSGKIHTHHYRLERVLCKLIRRRSQWTGNLRRPCKSLHVFESGSNLPDHCLW